MRTPYGKECFYYYQDFYRGKSQMECRLLGPHGGWTPPLCKDCPVPAILADNACPDMTLRGESGSGIFGLGRHVKVTAYCRRTDRVVAEPRVGCSECHRGLRDISPPPK
jgi:hypothetical protein